MEPVSPVMPGSEGIEVEIGKHQTQYRPLPAVRLDSPSSPLLSRWHLTDDERELVASGADLVITMLTYNLPVMPIHLQLVLPGDMPKLVCDEDSL